MSLFNNITQDFYDNLNNLGTNPFVLVVLIIIIIVYYIIFSFLGKSWDNDNDEPSGTFVIFEALLWGLFILLIFVNGLSYFLNIDVITEVKISFHQNQKLILKQQQTKQPFKQTITRFIIFPEIDLHIMMLKQYVRHLMAKLPVLIN